VQIFNDFPWLPAETHSNQTVGELAKTHAFRLLAVVGTWAMISVAFVNRPEWVEGWWRFSSYAIELIADQLPLSWGSELEMLIVAGVIWIQITSAIQFVRLILWLPFYVWRLRRNRSMVLDRFLRPPW
jgi:hypothetical protein